MAIQVFENQYRGGLDMVAIISMIGTKYDCNDDMVKLHLISMLALNMIAIFFYRDQICLQIEICKIVPESRD